MNQQHRFLFLIGGVLLVMALALWPGSWARPARANVTLVSFTAISLPGLPEIYIEWETATQFGTAGFFVTRSDSASGTYTRVSDFIEREGDDLTGAEYEWTDEYTTLNQAYWYKLEEMTQSAQSEFYGPIMAVAGVLVTAEPTATHTPTLAPTATFTLSPTATPTKQADPVVVNPTTSSNSSVVVTPRPATGATVTPRPGSSGGSSSAVVAAATSTPLSSVIDSQPQPPPVATDAPAVMPDLPAATAAAPAAAAAEIAQAPAPQPTAAAPVRAAPAVVVTEAAPAATPAASTGNSTLLLVGAACLFLGLAFFILRQVRQ